jgi:hypothetical protein
VGPDGAGPELVVELLLLEEDDEDEVELEVEVWDEVLEELEELEELELGGGVVVVLVVVVVSGVQLSLSDATGPGIGRFIAEIGVPGATLTLKVKVWPPTTVTVTVHAPAEAIGGETASVIVSAAPSAASNRNSFPLPGNFSPSPIRDQVMRGRSRRVQRRRTQEATA